MRKSKRQPEVKIQQQKSKLQEQRREIRQLRQKIKELETSRDHQRSKVKSLRKQLKKLEKRIGSCLSMPLESTIAGHKYDLRLVHLCISLYTLAGCSFRGVCKVLYCLQLEYQITLSSIPSKSSIENWVQKVGLYNYEEVAHKFDEDYCLILDESMVVGEQRMLLALGVKANKTGKEALGFEDVQVLSIAVKPSWKQEDVQDFVQKVQEKVGKSAVNAITDGGLALKKGLELAGLLRISDAGHEFCKMTEQVYKEHEPFKEWIKEVTKTRFQVFMKPVAYLMPPKQRTVARFTNLSFVTKWASKMLKALPTLSDTEREAFGWLENHKTILVEFAAVYEMNESILKILKNEGLSVKNIEKCIKICATYTGIVSETLISKILAFLAQEKAKLPSAETVWHASSDVLESLFGKYKHQSSQNALNGVTPLVLALCAMTGTPDNQQGNHEHIKCALESKSMADLKTWKEENLVDNQLVKRRKVLNK